MTPMSDTEPVPGHPLKQAGVLDVHPRERSGTSTCHGCKDRKNTHVCHMDVWMCSECCEDEDAGEGVCQRFIARERAGTHLVNRRHIPSGWGPDGVTWPGDHRVVDIGRAENGTAVMTNTEPGDPGWLGNPYKLKAAGGEYTRAESVSQYRDVFYRLTAQKPEFRDHVKALKGAVLLGWCVPELCHGDVVLEYLDLHG